MFSSKIAILVLLPLAAVNALPSHKRDIGDFVGSVFDEATSGAGSLFDHATSAVGSEVDRATSVFESALASETASSLFKQATSILGTETSQAFATIATVNGAPVVEVTSVGGPAITLATASGTTTSFAGHVFTVATGSPSSSSSSSSSSASSTSSSAAMSAYALSMSAGHLLGAASVVGSIFVGAFTVL